MEEIFFIESKSRFLAIFDPNTMNIFKWLNQFDYVIEILNVNDLDKSTFLLDNVKSAVLVEIMNHFCPRDPFLCSYEELSYSLEIIYGMPYSKQDGAYYRFLLRDQLPFEPVKHYFDILKNFLSQSFPLVRTYENLMFRFLEGLEDRDTRALLLNHPGILTLSEALSIAIKKESDKDDFKIPLT